MVLEAGKSKIKVQASLLPGENLLPTLQTDTLLCVLRRQRESKLWQVPLYKDTNPITGAPPSWPCYLAKTPSLNPTVRRWGLQHVNFRGTQTCSQWLCHTVDVAKENPVLTQHWPLSFRRGVRERTEEQQGNIHPAPNPGPSYEGREPELTTPVNKVPMWRKGNSFPDTPRLPWVSSLDTQWA